MKTFDLLMDVSDRMKQALDFHREQYDLMNFLSLSGYSAWHEFHLSEESSSKNKLKAFISTHTDYIVSDEPTKDVGLIKSLIGKKPRSEIGNRVEIIKSAWEAYRKWEYDSCKMYSEIAKQLSDIGDMPAYLYVNRIVDDVHGELTEIKNYIVTLENHSYDMPQIQSEQDTIAEKYIYRLRKLYKQYPKFHHFNSL